MSFQILWSALFSVAILILAIGLSVDVKKPVEHQRRAVRMLVTLLAIALWVAIGSVYAIIWGW